MRVELIAGTAATACWASAAMACTCPFPVDARQIAENRRRLESANLVIDATVMSKAIAMRGAKPTRPCDRKIKPWNVIHVYKVLAGRLPGAGQSPVDASRIEVRTPDSGHDDQCRVIQTSCGYGADLRTRGVYAITRRGNELELSDFCSGMMAKDYYRSTDRHPNDLPVPHR